MGKAEVNPVKGVKLFKENNIGTRCLICLMLWLRN